MPQVVPQVDAYVPSMPDAGHDSAVKVEDAPPPSGRLAWAGGGGYDEFPVTANAYQPKRAPDAMTNPYNAGHIDATIALLELQTDGSLAVQFATFLGGGDRDVGDAATLDADGNLYVAGTTESPDFPMLAPLDSTYAGKHDAWVAKFSSAGELLFSTYLGGAGFDTAVDIAVDSTGVYVLGATTSADFATTAGAVQPVFGGSTAGFADEGNGDAFVTKLALDGSSVLWSTFLGGNESDAPYTLALDAAGNPIVVGSTVSANFPTTATAHQPMHAAADPSLPPFILNDDGFVTRLAADGASILASTLLGGDRRDTVTGVSSTASDVYLSVYYESTNLPNTTPLGGAGRGKYFVAKLPLDLSAVSAQVMLESTEDFPAELTTIAVRADGSLSLLANTSTPFSLPGHMNVTPPMGQTLAYAHLTADLSKVVELAFPQGLAPGAAKAFAIDAHDRPYVLTFTSSPDNLTTGAAPGGGYDGYWGALALDGSAVKSGSYFGGVGDDDPRHCHFKF